jgi:hypothetical protein
MGEGGRYPGLMFYSVFSVSVVFTQSIQYTVFLQFQCGFGFVASKLQ